MTDTTRAFADAAEALAVEMFGESFVDCPDALQLRIVAALKAVLDALGNYAPSRQRVGGVS